MTGYASVAVFKRDGNTVFRAPRREASTEKTQARKSASRFWKGAISAPDKLVKIVVVTRERNHIVVSERRQPGRGWIEFEADAAQISAQTHLSACLAELGIDAASAPAPLPDFLEINGAIYRREI